MGALTRVLRGRWACRAAVLLVGVLACASLGWYVMLPRYYVAALESNDVRDDVDDRQAEVLIDRLGSMGPRALPAIMPSLSGGRPFRRGTCLLILVLPRIGQPAHERLLAEVERTKGTQACVGYVDALQEAFGDFTKTDYWVAEVRKWPAYEYGLWNQLRRRYGEGVPAIVGADRHMTPEFEAWWAAQRGHVR